VKLQPMVDPEFWVLGIIVDRAAHFASIHLGPLALVLQMDPPHVSMQELEKAQQEQYAEWMDELEQAGLIQRVRVVERMPSSSKVM